MENNITLQRFNNELLNPEIKLVNDLLATFLELEPKKKKLLIRYFKKQKVRYDGFKTFNLQRWYGGDVNPTLEIVEVENKFLFGVTHYGVLGPLSIKEFISTKERLLPEICKFFAHSENYFGKETK